MNNNLIAKATEDQLRTDIPYITSGDTIRIAVLVKDKKNTRSQIFEGVVIKTQGSGINYSVLVRKVNKNVYIERHFNLHSPLLKDIKVIKRGKVRQARIYYMRNRHGKSARIKEIRN